jgi:hypothetical protein
MTRIGIDAEAADDMLLEVLIMAHYDHKFLFTYIKVQHILLLNFKVNSEVISQ